MALIQVWPSTHPVAVQNPPALCAPLTCSGYSSIRQLANSPFYRGGLLVLGKLLWTLANKRTCAWLMMMWGPLRHAIAHRFYPTIRPGGFGSRGVHTFRVKAVQSSYDQLGARVPLQHALSMHPRADLTTDMRGAPLFSCARCISFCSWSDALIGRKI